MEKIYSFILSEQEKSDLIEKEVINTIELKALMKIYFNLLKIITFKK